MENILTIKNTFKINISVYILAVIAVFTAAYKEFLIIFYLIILHEIGHSLTANFLGIKIKEIKIYPLGGISKLDMPLNTNIYKELIILINGPLFQELSYLIAIIIFPQQRAILSSYNYGILIFNLLPIYPLDGGKILRLILDFFFPYKKSFISIIIISYIVLIIIFSLNLENIGINVVIIAFFLLYLIRKEEKKTNYIYNKFLLERYLNNYIFKDTKIVSSINDLYRNKKHIIKRKSKYYYEQEILKRKYKK